MNRFLLLIPVAGMFLCACASGGPGGVADGRLAACPKSPNCVSSGATDDRHRIAPIAFTGDPEAALSRLADIAIAMKGKVAERKPGYLHATFSSRVFGFTDDVEFLADPAAGVIQVRSAARHGYSDFGVNRKRMEEIRKRFSQ